ncbi:MAG: PilZ domain-containing protein [Photobacterium frigidiphilum]|uniref:PilZ domain-containing protein n=1 Tax=Photobacterium frigidiphilum TaxID=264736 RepID=UPI00300123E2
MLLDEYKGLIEQLIPVYDSEDFDDVFLMLTYEETGPTRLQLKLEIKRMMAPCQQIVDLRGRVKGECRPYDLHGLTHWLDDVAINTYHKRIKIYGGKFRVGLYEALINTRNNFRVLHHQEKLKPQTIEKTKQDTQFDANLIRFGHYLTREENRLQISTQVNLRLPFGQAVHGVTSDLSYSGAKFKVPSAFKYNLGQTVKASFPVLAEKCHDARLAKDIEYRILGIDDNKDNDSFKWLRLTLLSDNQVMKDTIKLNQNLNTSRSRNNHEDKVIQARTKGYEHCFLKHTASLPLFFSGAELKYSLLTEHNQNIWEDWHDERNQPVINHLLSEARMATLGKAGLKQCSTLIYSFYHEHNHKKFFYSAALPEMNQEQRQLFWQIGATRKSWRVTRITVYPIGSNDLERLQDVAPEMVEQFQHLTHIGVMQNLTNDQAQQDYRLSIKSQLPAKALHVFRHQRDPICQAKGVFFDPKPQRSEDRFKFKTPVEIQHPELGNVLGASIDFSTRGLNLSLAQPLAAKKDDSVIIKFTQLHKLDKNSSLDKMPYRIIRISPDCLNIQLTSGSGEDALKGEQFLRRLINHNEKKLLLSKETLPKGPLLLAMHQMLLTRLNCVPYFAEKINHKVTVKAIGCNFPLPALAKLFNQLADGKGFSLQPIFKNRVQRMLAETMRPIEIRQPFVHEVYLWVQRQGDSIQHIESKLLDEFDDLEQRINFVKKARQQGEFIAIRITAVPVLNPMTALIGEELGQLARLTMHRARALEVEFTSLIGSGEMFDITDEVLVRLEIN